MDNAFGLGLYYNTHSVYYLLIINYLQVLSILIPTLFSLFWKIKRNNEPVKPAEVNISRERPCFPGAKCPLPVAGCPLLRTAPQNTFEKIYDQKRKHYENKFNSFWWRQETAAGNPFTFNFIPVTDRRCTEYAR